MKKRMWLWCMIAAVGLAFNVACSDDDEDVTPEPSQSQPGDTLPPVVVVVDTMEVLTSEIEVVAEGQEISFVTRTNIEYTVDTDAKKWITVTSTGRALTADYTVTATVAANEGEAREGNITVTFSDEAKTVKTVVVKQAAKQAEDTPVPPVTEYETVTVTLDIIPGAAGTTVSAEEVAAKLGVADLAAALADGTVTYAGLNADGSVYTLEDGTVPAFTTNGPYGHWYNSECNPISWGAPDPNETGAVRLAYLEGDGVTYNLGYDNSSSLTPGTTYAIAGLYSNGDTKVKFEVAINVGEAPEINFEAPVADYVLEVEVAQDNGYGATYIALDGTEFGYWGAYSDPDKYMTTIQDVSVDITGEIEAKLGLDEGALEDALYGGDVLLGAYGLDADGNKYFRDAYTEHGSNTFFWYTVEGVAVGWGQNSVFCIDNIGFHDGNPRLYGTTCMFPNDAQIGTTYSGYIVFKVADDSAEYVVEVKGTAVAAPEKQPLKEYTVVDTYEKTYSAVNPGPYTTPDPIFSNEDIITDIQTLIGGEPDLILVDYLNENLEVEFIEWNGGLGGADPDGWFAANGAAKWGSDAVMFCLKPNTDGTFSYCAAINDGAVDACCTFRYCNTSTLKAVDVKVTVALTAPEA